MGSANGAAWQTRATIVSTTGSATGFAKTYTDTTVRTGTTYNYRIIASNVVGYVPQVPYVAPAIGYPTMTANSAPTVNTTVLV
jgi:hypothetical protein